VFDGLDASSEAPDVCSLAGRGTVGRVHSKTVNGRANDLSYIEIASIINIQVKDHIVSTIIYNTYSADI